MTIQTLSPIFGHAYEKTVADSIARWHRLKGEEVFFLTGTDEHGKKIQNAAEQAGMKPKAFVDMQVKSFKELVENWSISNDNFIRTTDPMHEKMCQELFQKVLDKGDIYLGEYEGLYCTNCEAFYLEKDLLNGLCPVHKKPLEKIKEESYFFRMSKYQEQWLEFIERNPEFILPVRRKQEIVNRVKEGLRDLSVSRTTFKWGIPLKNNSRHVIYVWFDALLNYFSGIDFPSKKFEKFWPADIHVIGKDILWFHAVIWPAMLFSLGIQAPKKIFVHGFINTSTGEKLSKSSGNVIDPIKLAEDYGVDSVRYYLLREIPLSEDGEFSEKGLITRHNTELANELGNLLHRTLTLIEKNFQGKIPAGKTDENLAKKLKLQKIGQHFDGLEVHLALSEIFSFVGACNKYLNEKEPWKLSGKELENVLYSVSDSLRVISILLSPVMPSASDRMNRQLGVKAGTLKECSFNLLKAGAKIGKKEILFKKFELKEESGFRAERVEVKIAPRLEKLGLKAIGAKIFNICVKKKHEGLEKEKRKAVEEADLDSREEQKVIQGYLDLYDALGVKRDKHAVKNLIEIARKSGKLPTINTVVDSYNLVSLKKGLVVGAHDLDNISGKVRVETAEGNELYVPLGENKKAKVDAGEYIFRDDKVVLCRLDVKQGEHTKITKETKNVFLYVQGNKSTPQKYLEDAMEEILGKIEKYCS